MAVDLIGRLIADNITEFGRLANEFGYDVPAEQEVSFILATAEASSAAPDASLVRTNIFSAAVASANAEAPTAELIRYKVLGLFPALADATAAEANLWAMPKFEPAAAEATAIAPAAEMKATQLLPNPFSLQLYATETGLPITTLYEFESLSFSRGENEAGRLSVTLPAGHPANKAIRDIYSSEPHSVYGVLYRRGEPWAGVTLAETDITSSPISWSFLTFEVLLREHITPWSWHGLENLSLSDAITRIATKGMRWHRKSNYDDLNGATKSDTELKTWAQLSGESGSGAYNQPLLILAKTGTRYKSSGSATFTWDFGDLLQLERIRWRCALGEYVELGMQFRYSHDNINWTDWTAESNVADQDYAETYGVDATSSYACRYVDVKFNFRTEDTSTKDQAGNPVGTSPVLFGVELLTSYDTGISAYSIDVPSKSVGNGLDYTHHNHLSVLAGICQDHELVFKIDHNKRLYVWTPSASNPVIIKRGETCEPSMLNYRGLDGIENVLTCYGAGEGIGRLTTVVRDEDSVLIYGERQGIFEDGKYTSLSDLTYAGQGELLTRAWPSFEAQIKAPYEEGRGILDLTVHDYITYVDSDTFTGTDELGKQTLRITSEHRSFSDAGEVVTLGLESDVDNVLIRDKKQLIKKNYKHGRAIGQVPFDVRAVAGFGAIKISWHGSAPEYVVECSADGLNAWKWLTKTRETNFLHSQLASGATYYYRVRALYADNTISGPSVVVYGTTTLIDADSFDTTAPTTPTGLSASTGTTDSTAGGKVMLNTLTWTANSETDLASYELQRSLDDIAWIAVGVIQAGSQSFVDTQGLVENTKYYYRIRAFDKTGNASEWSSSVNVTTVKDAVAPTFASTAPSVLVGYKRLVPSWLGSSSADISHYILQRQTAPAEWDGVNNVWKVPTTPVPGSWAAITGAAIRALQFHDTEVDFDNCYRYKVAAVDTSGNISSYTSESLWAVPSQVGTADIAYRKITAEMYAELRQTMPYTWRQELDSSKPIEIPFHIPSETTQIVSIKLSAYGNRFRASSTGAAAGGSHSHTVELPNHTHSVGYSITFGDGGLMTGSAGGHSHDVTGSAATDGSHNHYVQGSTSSDSGHSHSVNINSDMDGSHDHSVTGSTDTDGAHTHSQQYTAVNTTTGSGGGSTETSSNQDAHSHDIIYGIYESTTPAVVNLYIDNGAGYGSAIALASAPDTTTPYELAEELDITAHITTAGWKKLKFTSSRLGAIDIQLICKVDITA